MDELYGRHAKLNCVWSFLFKWSKVINIKNMQYKLKLYIIGDLSEDIFIIMDQITYIDEPTVNFLHTLQFFSALRSVSVSFSLLFLFLY